MSLILKYTRFVSTSSKRFYYLKDFEKIKLFFLVSPY